MENLFALQFTPRQVNAISNLGLAHMGDGVYELLCRSYLCCQGEKTVLRRVFIVTADNNWRHNVVKPKNMCNFVRLIPCILLKHSV